MMLNPVTIKGYTTVVYCADVALSTNGAAIATAKDGAQQIILQNNDSGIVISIGNATTQNIKLAVGASITLNFSRPELIYAKSASGTPNLSVLILG